MRLWTFQDKDAWNKLKDYGIWYSNFDYTRRLKMVDEQYIQKDFQTPYGVIDTSPIYSYSSLGRFYKCLNIHTISSGYNRIDRLS